MGNLMGNLGEDLVEGLRDGLTYKVYYKGDGTGYQVGARIRDDEPLHGGNAHFVGDLFDTKEEAEIFLEKMKMVTENAM